LAKVLERALEGLLWGRARRGRAAEFLRVALVCGWKFLHDRGPLRASALAFTTTLGLVPLLALAFAVVKGIGAESAVIHQLIGFLWPGNPQIADRITEYVGRIKVSTLGLAGFGSLTLSALFVMNNVEHSFNDIWGAARGRTFLRKLTDYSAILIFCPILLLLSTSMTTTAQASRLLGAIEMVEKALPLLFSLGPLLAKALAFAAAYLVIPNHRVGWVAAGVGGLTAAVFWGFAESWYIGFGLGMVRTNAAYGALAHLPAFLLWIYVGWCIVLLGAELACVLELPGRGRYLKGGGELWSPRPTVALALLVEVALDFAEGKPSPDEELIARSGFHPVEGRRVIGELVDCGLLAYLEGEPSRLVPARSPEQLKIAEVFRLLGACKAGAAGPDSLEALLAKDLRSGFGETSWGEWARKAREHSSTGKGAEKSAANRA